LHLSASAECSRANAAAKAEQSISENFLLHSKVPVQRETREQFVPSAHHLLIAEHNFSIAQLRFALSPLGDDDKQ
jgi:hypothetical protein